MSVLLENKAGLHLAFGGLLIHSADNARFIENNYTLSTY